jgi:hypothetical protein
MSNNKISSAYRFGAALVFRGLGRFGADGKYAANGTNAFIEKLVNSQESRTRLRKVAMEDLGDRFGTADLVRQLYA